jgi:hypothetical protein
MVARLAMADRLSAELIAEVVADIRAGRAQCPAATDRIGTEISHLMLGRAQLPQPVVDCQEIFRQQLTKQEIRMYDDWPSATPPWVDAIFGYVNTYGNTIIMQVHRVEHDGATLGHNTWRTENPVDWARVKWISEASIWVGGHSVTTSRNIPTSGPCHIIRHAIRDDGAPEDINWIALLAKRGQFGAHTEIDDPAVAIWEATMVTLSATLNFLNASNVDIAVPARPRAERRRIARTGVEVQTIVVRPPGKRRAGGTGVRPIDSLETVLSPVRGHFSHYGERYGRGLLFGKLEGKFWIPGHVRGAGDGEPQQRDYQLRPAEERYEH